MHVNNEIKEINIKIIMITVYILISYYYVNTMPIRSDTYEYYLNYINIDKYMFPYGIELALPLIMKFFHTLGFSFHGFMFFLLIGWLPIYYAALGYAIKKPLYFGVVILFMLSPLFQRQVIFLMRSYLSALFLCYFFMSNKKNKLLFLFLATISHLSSLFFVLFLNKKVGTLLLKYKSVFISFSLIALILSKDFFMLFINILESITLHINLLPELTRKIAFYKSGGMYLSSISNTLILIAFSLSILILFSNDKMHTELVTFVYSQAIVLILMSGNIVAASRMGFFVFFFYIPMFAYVFYHISLNLKKLNGN
ncbi:TPA: EpsG family protein [Photobacterium damselae]